MSATAGIVVSSIHVASTSLYLGGAITMELLLRHAQRDLPGPQTAVTCQVSGKMWRWWAQGALGLAGVSFFVSAARIASAPAGIVVVYSGVWFSLFLILLVLSYRAHPALARRVPPDAPPEIRARNRQELRKAIARMDKLLRAELCLAAALTFVSSAYLEAIGRAP